MFRKTIKNEVRKQNRRVLRSREEQYVATITQDIEERELISVVDFQFGEMNIYFYLCQDCSVMKTEIQGT